MSPTDLVVARARPDEWRALRELRLRALTDAPEAFASTPGREQALDERGWRARLTDGAWFVGRVAGRAVGLACGVPDGPDVRMLVGMWVEPARRGDGTATALVDAVAAWARADGARELSAWVADPNARARRFYARQGFVPTGEHQPLPSRPEIPESRLRLALGPRPA